MRICSVLALFLGGVVSMATAQTLACVLGSAATASSTTIERRLSTKSADLHGETEKVDPHRHQRAVLGKRAARCIRGESGAFPTYWPFQRARARGEKRRMIFLNSAREGIVKCFKLFHAETQRAQRNAKTFYAKALIWEENQD